MRADKDDSKRNITINAIYELTEQGKNNISTADIRKDIKLKFEQKGINFYLILDSLLTIVQTVFKQPEYHKIRLKEG
jgi:hypothetical protein